jgi:excisionase family DNA binding protein
MKAQITARRKYTKRSDQAPQGAKLFRAREAAELLRLHVVTLRKKAKEGSIPSISLGPRSLRFDLAAVRLALSK